jgi:uncharacterized protein
LPLHIFEPRYRQMTADALTGEQMIAMALTTGRTGEPSPVHEIVGLGKILAHEELGDGRYHLVLRGLTRARLIEELPAGLPYRVGVLELLDDEIDPDVDQTATARKLLQRFEQSFPKVRQHPVWGAVRSSRVPLGSVCDLLVSALPVVPNLAQQFLNDVDVMSRVQGLMEVLEQIEVQRRSTSKTAGLIPTATTERRRFPPPFSEN